MSGNVTIKDWDYLALLLRALDAVKNRKAFLLGGGTLLLATTFFALGNLLAIKMFPGSPTSMVVMIGIVAILAILIYWAGFSGVGLLLMDQAHDIELRSVMDALIGGLMSTGKFVTILLLDGLFWVLFLGACSLLLLACKIPGIGPLLYALVYPVVILASGLVVAALVFVVLPMTFPAIWEGNSMTGIYARRWALFQHRRVQIYVSQLILVLVASLVGTIVFVVLFSGFGISTLLSLPIVGEAMQLESFMAGLLSMMQGGSGGGSGYIVAGVLGGGILFFFASLIPGMVVISGMNLIYLRAIEGLDFSVAEGKISKGIEDAKRRAEEAKARAAEASQKAREAATQRAASASNAEQPETSKS